VNDYDRRRLHRIREARERSRRERCARCGGWYLHDPAFHTPSERCPHCEAHIHTDLAIAAGLEEDR